MHCVIERGTRGWVLRDLESANGTYLNGRRCEEAALIDGDVLQIGRARFIFDAGALRPAPCLRQVRLDVRGLVQRAYRRGRPITQLDDVSFTVYPNEVVAIVGPSGAGKTTLINALNGLRPAAEGEVFYNGIPFYEHVERFRAGIGFVPQDDIIHRELPVHSVLRYAARLRLPDETSDEDVETLIEEVLAELDLTHRRDAVVSTLSGGERKRVNIGVELLTRPSLLLLDEPTSGLDPGLERRVVALIRRLSGEGRTVLFVTHATESIAQCDLVLFLGRRGQVAFFGPPEAALEFFGVDDYAEAYLKLSGPEEEKNPWPELFRGSRYYREFVLRRQERLTHVEAPPEPPPARGARPLAHLPVLLRRQLEVMKGDVRNLLILLLQAPAIAVILALIYQPNTFTDDLATTPGEPPPVRDGAELLFLMVIAALWFGTVNAAREISKERAIFTRERLAGVGISPYLLSKVGVLALVGLVQSLLLLGIIGLRIEFTSDSGTWWMLLATLFMASVAAGMIGLAMSAAAANSDQAVSLVPVVLLPQVVLSGLLLDPSDLGPLSGVANLAPARWAYGGLAALTDLGGLYSETGIARSAKEIFDTDPVHALAALTVIAAACLAASAAALALRQR
jgi:ABC-type multidrug transport system ATPase subunit